jgi:prephenate dehydrogenase
MRVLLISTYELGHQPVQLAMPAAALLAAGHEVRCVDVAVDPLDVADVDWADRVAFSVPMHTAMRLALRVAETIGARRLEVT